MQFASADTRLDGCWMRGFDLEAGRLDLSNHPFTSGIHSGDTRLTTRYKPDPDPYLTAVGRSGFQASECVAVEDSERGLASAAAAGIRCIVIPRGLSRGGNFTGAWKVLKDIAEGNLSQTEALDIVAEAAASRTKLLKEYLRITGDDDGITFKKLHSRLGKLIQDKVPGGETENEMELLRARCNIFEALLIKHFRSADDFEKLVMK